jgi:hypothetical protein
LNNFYRLLFSKWPPQYHKNSTLFFQWQESIQDIIIDPHIKFWWYRTMLNFCGIVVAILKMATGRNCSMSRINSELIRDIEKFLPVVIFKMATTIPQKINIVRFQCHFICG